MRNGIINAGSSKEDVLAVLTGTWNEYNDRGWHIVKTPFFVALSGTFQAGRQQLPGKPKTACLLTWANANGDGHVVIPALATGFDLPENAIVNLTLFGTETY